jgi:hypothetical protein
LRTRTSDRVGENGFSLVEAITATVIATLAVIGLAYSFSQGRGLIDRFEIARAALGTAQARMERLTFLPLDSDSLVDGSHPVTPNDFLFEGRVIGSEAWRVEAFDDPTTSETDDMKRVVVSVRFQTGALQDSVTLSRLFRRVEP